MTDTWTQADVRAFFDRVSDHIEDWQGLPIMLGENSPLVLAKGHPMKQVYGALGELDDGIEVEDCQSSFVCSTADIDEEERIVNEWWSRKRNCTVLVVDRGGRRYAAKIPRAPDRSMERLGLWLTTIGAADAWDPAAENRARIHLADMLSERQWFHYDMTGCFLETSPRSKLTYVFRRLRPTLVLSPRWAWWHKTQPESMRCLAVLCMHPVGYYSRSWGGCMVPSDDVIAHLSMMRADEAYYWRMANAHDPASPEAGL